MMRVSFINISMTDSEKGEKKKELNIIIIIYIYIEHNESNSMDRRVLWCCIIIEHTEKS